MTNKLITTAIAVAALAFCGQSFAQVDRTGRVPNINPNLPDQPTEPVKPQADADTTHHKTKKSHAKKSKSSKKNTESQSDGASPPSGGDTAAPSE